MMRCDFGWGSTSASTRSATACLLSGSSPACLFETGRPPRPRAARPRGGRRGSLPEEVLERDLCPLARVDLARLKAVAQLLGRQVDEHDLVGFVEDPVRKRLADPDVRQLENAVVQALEVLNVDRRDDVDSGREYFVDVLEALAVPHAFCVRMGELVDECELRGACDDSSDVHVLDLEPSVQQLETWHRL